MRKLTAIICTLIIGSAFAQAWDFELGRQTQGYGQGPYGLQPSPQGFSVANSAWYGLVRYNYPVTKNWYGSQVWVLPEGGLFLTSPLTWYARIQVLIDTPGWTLFGDCRTDGTTEGCRFGVRFSL